MTTGAAATSRCVRKYTAAVTLSNTTPTKKYKEAVAEAVEACADDTKGQTCFICTQALHWKTKEGLVRGCACRGTAGFVHVSCLAEQAKILVAEADENNLDDKRWNESWGRWYECSMCKQQYHGDVNCALGWACWKTYVGRPETDEVRRAAMTQLGLGLFYSRYFEDALSVQQAELSMLRRLGVSEHNMLIAQSNIAGTYQGLGRLEQALRMRQDVYSGRLKLNGEEHEQTLQAANNYASALKDLRRFKEAKSLMRRQIPVAQRALGKGDLVTLRMRYNYARSLYEDNGATLDDLHEAVTTLEDISRIARRVLGGAHPFTEGVENELRIARAVLGAHEMRATLPVPRFKVGARVECYIDDAFSKGTVVGHHYRESAWEPGVFAPYQVKLDDVSPGLIFARCDEDGCIRAADADAETLK